MKKLLRLVKYYRLKLSEYKLIVWEDFPSNKLLTKYNDKLEKEYFLSIKVLFKDMELFQFYSYLSLVEARPLKYPIDQNILFCNRNF